MVLIFTGCRVGEIIALTWDDVDFEHRRINISKNYSRIRDEETGKYIDIITTPKTEESRREILLNDAALYWLKEMKSRNEELGIGTGTDDRIVVSKKNKILRQCNVDNRLKTFCEKIGVEYKSSHSGRKTYTSVLLDNGASLSDVSQELGHKNISTTQNSYYKSRRTRDAKLQQRNEIFRATAGSRLVVKKNIPEAAEIQGITA